jgi:hypothetical protein
METTVVRRGAWNSWVVACAAVLVAAGGHGSASAQTPAAPPSSKPATIRLGDRWTLFNDTGAPLAITGVLLLAGDPAQPLYHGILSDGLDLTLPPPPFEGRVLRLRFAASGAQFDLYAKRAKEVDGTGFTVWQPPAAELAKVPEIELAGEVAEYLIGEGERAQGSATDPIEIHVVRRGDRLATVTKSGVRMKMGGSSFTCEDRGDSLAVYREGSDVPLLVQRNEAGARPCLQPLMAPDLDGALTEFMPDHHHHQTGVYFGLPEVNGRSYFHTTRQGNFRRGGHFMLKGGADGSGRWTIADQWLGDHGPVATETQSWRLADHDDWYVLDLDWSLLANEDVTVAQYDYGGLFIRMPWRAATGGHAVNSEGLKDAACEGQRARWVDVGVPVPGRKDGDGRKAGSNIGHIALLDHPSNEGHPEPFRVDDQFGFGPCRARLGAWKVARAQTANAKFRLVVYLGDFDREKVESSWKEFAAVK